MQLRPYQQAAIDGIFEWWGERKGENPLVVLSTGSGKTVIFSTLIKQVVEMYSDTRILILAHTKELVEQAEDKLKTVWPEAPVGVYAAGLKRRELCQITCASRDTIRNVIDQVGKFDLVFIDEAHLIPPRAESSYMRIIEALRKKNKHLNVIGFTATPYRTGTGFIYGNDDKHIFQGVAYEAKIADLMEQGYLCPIVSKCVSQDAVADVSEVKTTAGDFNQGQLQEIAIQVPLIRASLDEWQRLGYEQGRKSSVFFCVSILHAELVSQELLKRGFDCPVVHGGTPSDERAEILKEFDEGRLTGVVNVGVLTTGWDAPRLDCVVLMRPTKSLNLFMQMVGRGLRLHPSKTNTLLLDFGGCLERFGPIDLAQPVSRKSSNADKVKNCPSCESIVGYFKRKCPHCEHEFLPPVHKICDHCGEENPPSAAKCIKCDQPFVKHESRASSNAVMSTDVKPWFEVVPIESISIAPATSKAGRPYLRVTFIQDVLNRYHMNLMIGFPGYAGKKAKDDWHRIAREGVPVPLDPNAAYRWYKHDSNIFRPVNKIKVDMNSKFKDIHEIYYENEEHVA